MVTFKENCNVFLSKVTFPSTGYYCYFNVIVAVQSMTSYPRVLSTQTRPLQHDGSQTLMQNSRAPAQRSLWRKRGGLSAGHRSVHAAKNGRLSCIKLVQVPEHFKRVQSEALCFCSMFCFSRSANNCHFECLILKRDDFYDT